MRPPPLPRLTRRERRPDAVLFLLERVDAADLTAHGLPDLFLNVGSGQEVSIAELARLICRVAGYQGQLLFDPDKPNGTPRKLMDSGRMAALGWRAETGLEAGIRAAYQWYCSPVES